MYTFTKIYSYKYTYMYMYMHVYDPEPEPEPYSNKMSEPEPSSNLPVPQPWFHSTYPEALQASDLKLSPIDCHYSQTFERGFHKRPAYVTEKELINVKFCFSYNFVIAAWILMDF